MAGHDHTNPSDGNVPTSDNRVSNLRIRNVYQPSEREILLEVFSAEFGAVYWLFSAHPVYPRVVRTHIRGKSPARPSVFCQWLRTRLIGGSLDSPIRRAPGVIEISITHQEGLLCLLLEQNGKESNLLLLDGDNNLLIALRHPSLPGRHLAAGGPYHPPQRHTFLPTDAPDEDRGNPKTKTEIITLDRAWRDRERIAGFAQQQIELSRKIRNQLKRIRRRVAKQEADFIHAQKGEELRMWGELLNINRHLLKPRLETLSVINEFDPERSWVEIPLDPEISPSENIEKLFQRYRKQTQALPHIEKRMEEAKSEKNQWEALGQAVDEASSPGALDTLRNSWTRAQRSVLEKPSQREAPKRAESEEVMTRISSDGMTILIGRNKYENDRVTFRMGNGRDWWFHAQGIPGSHVIVKSKDGALPPSKTVEEAAWLAGYYSQRRKEGKLDVDYTQRKFVRKIKGAEPGQVTFSQNKTIWVNLEGEAGRVLESRQE